MGALLTMTNHSADATMVVARRPDRRPASSLLMSQPRHGFDGRVRWHLLTHSGSVNAARGSASACLSTGSLNPPFQCVGLPDENR